MSEPVSAQAPLVDSEHPWLGLLPFKEVHRKFFFGRDDEIVEMLGRIRENSLTVLFGQSGLGKTSLLGAAVVPALREAAFAPVLLRLEYTTSKPPLLEQTRAAFRSAMPGIAWPEDAAATTLWEFFHRIPDLLPPGSPAPLLIFDQFEEIFTLGHQDPAREREAELWLEQMADLLQNRPPHALEDRFAENRRLARDFDFGPSPLRVVFALREDYLSHLEGWKNRLPLLTQNRMALLRLNGLQALEAVLGPASLGEHPLVSREVAAGIVRTVARVEPETPLPQIRAVPPLLSLLCEQLNAARLAAGATEITADMVTGQSQDILQRFYVESYAAFPAERRETIRALIEDPPMITEGGYRNSLVREDAEAHLARLGVTDPRGVFDALIQRRLITGEEDDGVQRLEVTHDVLVPLLVRSRKERRERVARELAERQARAKRLKAIAWSVACLAIAGFSLGLTSWALAERAEAARQAAFAKRQAIEAVNQTRLVEAEERELKAANLVINAERAAAEAAAGEARNQTALTRAREKEVEREKARALDLIRFMDAQVGEAFVDAVPVQLRERVSARVDAFYTELGTLATLDEHERMGYHLRKAQVHLAAVRRYETDFSPELGKVYIAWERDSASIALKEALRLGDDLAADERNKNDRGVARDRILGHFYFATLLRQTADGDAATAHERDAKALLDALVQAGPFSAAQLAEWMDLPNLDLVTGHQGAARGEKNTPRKSIQNAAVLQTQHPVRRPNEQKSEAGLNSTVEPRTNDLAQSHTNDLGMHFVTVKGTSVLFSIHETRVKDFRAFVRESGYVHMRETADANSRMWSLDRDGLKQRGHSWENPGFPQTEDHPVVGVNWNDAKSFCEWLTARERGAGRLPVGWEYRLPRDHEWSAAVGLTEEAKETPKAKDETIKERYPWGEWAAGQPPPDRAGNYAGEEADDAHWPGNLPTLKGYQDGHARTAPVGSFTKNKFGIFDLGGNVWEWCEDEYSPGTGARVLRGASWDDSLHGRLLSSSRLSGKPSYRRPYYGFRCVMGSSSP